MREYSSVWTSHTSTSTWIRPSLVLKNTAGSWTTWSSLTGMRLNTPLMFGLFCNAVLINAVLIGRSLSTTSSGYMPNLRWFLRGFICPVVGIVLMMPSSPQCPVSSALNSSRTDLRSFVGLVNQLSTSTSAIAGLLSPLRPLLSTRNEFLWSSALNDVFESVKQSMMSSRTLSFFDPHRATRLCTDASRQGLGFVLQQLVEGSSVLVQAGSRFLSDTESHYAVIELEMLAVSWAIFKCRLLLAGLPHFHVVADHPPPPLCPF